MGWRGTAAPRHPEETGSADDLAVDEPRGGGRDGEAAHRPSASGLSPLVLAFCVFTSGAVLLGVEIAASRVLAPYFGNSLFVWGALIGVVLSGLAIGYWLGGVLADRLPASSLLAAALAAGGVAVLVVPFVDEPVLEWIVSLAIRARA